MATATQLRYLGTGVYVIALVIAAIVLNPIGSDEASITNSFATVTGVLIGLHFVVHQKKERTKEMKKMQPNVMWYFMISLLVSLISSMRSFSTPYDWIDSKVLFVISAGFFAFSTAYFVGKVGLLSDEAS